jgi:hypothetical protein
MNMPVKGCEVAMATALVESNIHVYANSAVPASLKCPFDPGFIGEYSVYHPLHNPVIITHSNPRLRP